MSAESATGSTEHREQQMNRRNFITHSATPLASRAALPAILAHPQQKDTHVPHISIHRVEADGVTVFYREAGAANAPVLLLLHGFPASSFMYRELMPLLADRYRLIAPDLPGFGFTEIPAARHY